MSSDRNTTDKARLLKAVALTDNQPPDWLQAGQEVYSDRFGYGTITHLLGKRVFVEFPSDGQSEQQFSASWQQIISKKLLIPATEARRPSVTLPRVPLPVRPAHPSAVEVEAELAGAIAQIPHAPFQTIAWELAHKLERVVSIPPTAEQSRPLPRNLHPSLKAAVRDLGFTHLYSHQAKAFKALQAGQDVLLTTPTASGKTLSYSLGVLNAVLHDRTQTALCLFPLKALALDQLGKLQAISDRLPASEQLKIGLMTGDTPMSDRKQLFTPNPPHILCLSPDLLHFQLYRTSNRQAEYEPWRLFLRQLRFVVVDEAHTYTAGLGAHFTNLMRRLRLAIDRLGGDADKLQFVFSSATIGNPIELALKFSGREDQPEQLQVISESGAAKAEQTLLCLQPSGSPNADAAEIVISWLQKGLSGIVFLNTRSATKHLLSLIQEKLRQGQQANLGRKVAIFYGSLRDDRRRELVHQLKTGALQVILSTSALEAGIDIPALDCCLLRGYPGSLMSFHQRKGRAGRRRDGLIIFLPMAQNPLDYYFGKNPELLLHSPVERAMFNADYPIVLSGHLQCACCESGMPSQQVEQHFGPLAGTIADELIEQQRIFIHQYTQELWADGYPHREVSLRGSVQESITLIDQNSGEELEEMNQDMAYREVHPGAVYAIQDANGQLRYYRSTTLDLERRIASLSPFDQSDLETKSHGSQRVELLQKLKAPEVIETNIPEGRLRLTLGWGQVVTRVEGYELLAKGYDSTCINPKCAAYHRPLKQDACPYCGRVARMAIVSKVLEEVDFEEPYTTQFDAPVLRLEVNPPLQKAIAAEVRQLKIRFNLSPDDGSEDVAPELTPLVHASPEFLAMHSLAHQICLATPLLVLGSVQDVNCLVEEGIARKQTLGTIAHFYDTYEGGNGVCEAIFSRFTEFAAQALAMAESCPCDHGCPRCLTYHGCPQHNHGLFKALGMFVLRSVLNA